MKARKRRKAEERAKVAALQNNFLLYMCDFIQFTMVLVHPRYNVAMYRKQWEEFTKGSSKDPKSIAAIHPERSAAPDCFSCHVEEGTFTY